MVQAHATTSPDGRNILFVRDLTVGVRGVDTGQTRFASLGPKFTQSKVTFLRCSWDGTSVVVFSDNVVKVLNINDSLEPVAELDNGSGGLGRIISADLIAHDSVLAVWEFGKVKLWNIHTGKHVDLPDLKMSCSGQTKQLRPVAVGETRSANSLALLSRIGAEDHLVLHFPSSSQPHVDIRLPTSDAQSLCWSPNGRWLAILDVPTAYPSLQICTPDGHLFRSYPSTADPSGALGVKDLMWSTDDRLLALAKHDGRIELLNTKTFTLLAIIQHSTTVDQRSLAANERAAIWQESVSASNVRSHAVSPHPVSPPLSKAKTSISEPSELGVVELCFNNDGTFLASRDARMLNTVWLWNMATLSIRAMLIQHSNVRKLIWHPTRRDILMIDCAEDTVQIYDMSSTKPPRVLATEVNPKARLSWLPTTAKEKSVIMATESIKFHLLYPEGKGYATENDVSDSIGASHPPPQGDDILEDSLFDVLSGRTPLPPKTQPSYMEMVDIESEAADESIGDALDDTFRQKRQAAQVKQAEIDPLDDSDIF